MKRISSTMRKQLRADISKNNVIGILKKLKKLGGFSKERGLIKKHWNMERFLDRYKLMYSRADRCKFDKELFDLQTGAYVTILRKLN